MKKRYIALIIVMVISSIMSTGCKISRKIDGMENKTQATEEPYEFLNKWDPTLFEVFGFEYLAPPEKAYYPTIEKGKTYLKAEFKVNNYETFEEFFIDVYEVMWGQISDPKQVLTVKDKVHSFEGEYVVAEIYRRATENSLVSDNRVEKNAWISIKYIEADRKCVMEARLLKEPKKKTEN